VGLLFCSSREDESRPARIYIKGHLSIPLSSEKKNSTAAEKQLELAKYTYIRIAGASGEKVRRTHKGVRFLPNRMTDSKKCTKN
jgi:hypothetical protein